MIGTLTMDDRDTLDRAQGRIRRLSALLVAIEAHVKSPLEGVASDELEKDARESYADLVELIYEDSVTIDKILDAADARAAREAKARRAKGGAE